MSDINPMIGQIIGPGRPCPSCGEGYGFHEQTCLNTTETNQSAKWAYCFTLWPAETWGFKRALFNYFQFINTSCEMEFTEAEFERFRSELNHDGFTLREITRVPYREPETIL